MMLGTLLKGLNAIYARRPVEFVFVVISQVVLMCALFGFMDLLIVVKWTTDWEKEI
jgi:vacuolar-type H+-ATPase subunit I/STV1